MEWNMPCDVSFESEGLYVRFSKVVTAEDIVTLIVAMQSPAAEKFQYRLTDCLSMQDFQLSEVHIAHILSLDYVISLGQPSVLRAVVSNDPVLIEKIGEWTRKYDHSSGYRLFSTLEAAREWSMQAQCKDCVSGATINGDS
jgi:hypothetical protein